MTAIEINRYRRLAGDESIEEMEKEASSLSERHILHINSTFQGGGVAEILERLVPFLNYLGIDTGWRILHGDTDFFGVTKKFHNALQGKRIHMSAMKKKVYVETNRKFSTFTHIDHDLVVVHDPQPLPLISLCKKAQPWIWRSHIDISSPNPPVWEYLRGFVSKYDMMVVSADFYRRKDVRIPQRIIRPSIDPLDTKNVAIPRKKISKYLSKNGVKRDKPIITQVSRFDRWKDPLGAIKVFKRVKKRIDCRLVLAGSFASDDPEGQKVYEGLMEHGEKDEDIDLIVNGSDIFINALQRASSVILQKSIKEGFGITVTEGLWKGKPVVASEVGGIPLQVRDGENGYLVGPRNYSGFAKRIVGLLENPRLAEKMGERGREIVRENFLITRHALDWIRVVSEGLGRKRPYRH